MKKGENIYKRQDGRWEARYIKGYEISGKIKYGSCYGKTYKEAKEKVAEVKAALFNGAPTPTNRSHRRFAFYCDEWLLANRGCIKESTYVKYHTILENHIKPKLGGCFALGLTPTVTEAFRVELEHEGLAAKTIKDILVVLRSILNYGIKHFPGIFPAVEVLYPKETKKEMRVLSKEEETRLTAYLLADLDCCRFGILLALLTGIRIGELCALRWSDVSLRDKTLRVGCTMQRLHNCDENGTKTKVIIGTPKSDSSFRTIPITRQALELCKKMNPGNKKDYILTGTEDYMEPRALQYRFEKYTRDCQLEGVHFHTLRHTFATRCVEVGFEIKTLSEILGHSTTTITLDRYVHSSMEMKRTNMEKLAAAGF